MLMLVLVWRSEEWVEVAVEVGVRAARAVGVGVAGLSTEHTASISSKVHHWG